MDKSTRETMFSSKSDEWSTPQDLYDYLDLKYGPFHLDPCATKESAKCPNFLTMEDDALSPPHFHPDMGWGHMYWNAFVNPPYSDIKRWTEAAYLHGQWNDRLCALLIPSRTCTKYFHDYCMKAHTIVFIKGRLKFGDNKNSAPFPSMVALFGAYVGGQINRTGKPLVDMIDYGVVKAEHEDVVKKIKERNDEMRGFIVKCFEGVDPTGMAGEHFSTGMMKANKKAAKRLCRYMGFTDLLG